MSHVQNWATALILTALLVSCGSADVRFSRGLQAYDLGEYARAMEYWEPLVESGHARAQHSLGVMYFKGEGVVQDYDQAIGLFRDAVNGGAHGAALSLTVMYAHGYGTEADPVTAYQWARVADDQDDGNAPHWLGTLQRQLSAEQIKAAQQGAATWKPSN